MKEWISILEKSGIVYILKPYTPSVLKRAVKTPKLYFRDTGLCCYLTRWLTPETLKNGAAVDVSGEIDLIIHENGILYPVEIKMSTMPKAIMASEFELLDGIPDKKWGMGAIICLLDRKMYLQENLVALPLEYL